MYRLNRVARDGSGLTIVEGVFNTLERAQLTCEYCIQLASDEVLDAFTWYIDETDDYNNISIINFDGDSQ